MTAADKAAIGEAAIALAKTIPGGAVAAEALAAVCALVNRGIWPPPPSLAQQKRIDHAIRTAYDAGAESISRAVVDPDDDHEEDCR